MSYKKISLMGEITASRSNEFINDFMDLEAKRGGGDIIILIDSEGGSVRHALALYDTIKTSPVRTFGLVVGQCLSAATLVLQACTQRLLLPHTTFMMHRGSAGTGFVHESEFRASYRAACREEKDFNEALFQRCKISQREFEKLNSRGAYLDAEETVKLGFADMVVARRGYTKQRRK
jgi:ATP-dependent protease ClpP protease subunit